MWVKKQTCDTGSNVIIYSDRPNAAQPGLIVEEQRVKRGDPHPRPAERRTIPHRVIDQSGRHGLPGSILPATAADKLAKVLTADRI